MTDDYYPDPADRELLREEDQLLARLIGDYVERRETGAAALAHELLAVAAEFGARTREKLEDLIVIYELHREGLGE